MALTEGEALTVAFAWAALVAAAAVVLYVGYLAYDLRAARARAAARPPPGPDPLVALRAVDAQVLEGLAQASQTLDRARAAVQRGVEG